MKRPKPIRARWREIYAADRLDVIAMISEAIRDMQRDQDLYGTTAYHSRRLNSLIKVEQILRDLEDSVRDKLVE